MKIKRIKNLLEIMFLESGLKRYNKNSKKDLFLQNLNKIVFFLLNRWVGHNNSIKDEIEINLKKL